MSRLDAAVRALSDLLSGERGVRAVYGASYDGQSMIVVATSTGEIPLGTPHSFHGFPVAVVKAAQLAHRNEGEVQPPAAPPMPWWRMALLATHALSAPVAMAFSYKRNESLFRALLTGVFIPTPYLIYVLITPEKNK